MFRHLNGPQGCIICTRLLKCCNLGNLRHRCSDKVKIFSGAFQVNEWQSPPHFFLSVQLPSLYIYCEQEQGDLYAYGSFPTWSGKQLFILQKLIVFYPIYSFSFQNSTVPNKSLSSISPKILRKSIFLCFQRVFRVRWLWNNKKKPQPPQQQCIYIVSLRAWINMPRYAQWHEEKWFFWQQEEARDPSIYGSGLIV